MKVWVSEDELWPDMEVSITRPVYTEASGPGWGGKPLPGWDEYDVPEAVVSAYEDARGPFLNARDRLLDALGVPR